MKHIKNIVAIDQEDHSITVTMNGETRSSFDPFGFDFPDGGGIVVGDGNVWGVQNPLSVSQFCWKTEQEKYRFVAHLAAQGYRAIEVHNKLARRVTFTYNCKRPEAVLALWRYADELVARNGSFDSGHEVRPSRGDISHGQRAIVTRDFLRVQNDGGYESLFMQDVVQVAFMALAKEDRPLFDLRKTKAAVVSPRRLAAIACAVYDPYSGQLRTHNGKPWGMQFIVRRVIGLNGTMRGTGEHAPGNPMRAALRFAGGRYAAPDSLGKIKHNGKPILKQDLINRQERTRTDYLIRDLIRAFQAHGPIRPAIPDN
jgi:hypothetical protein